MDNDTYQLIAGMMVLALGSMACSSPSRPFSTRAIDDPITSTKGMVQLSLSVGKTYRDHPNEDSTLKPTNLDVEYGLSDRLTLHEFIGLSYTLLEQQPLDDRLPDVLSLRAGARLSALDTTIGWGDVFGPELFLELKRRLGWQFWVAGSGRVAVGTRRDPERQVGVHTGVLAGWQTGRHVAVLFNPWVSLARKPLGVVIDPGAFVTYVQVRETRLGSYLGVDVRLWRGFGFIARTGLGQRYVSEFTVTPEPGDPVLVSPEPIRELTFDVSAVARF